MNTKCVVHITNGVITNKKAVGLAFNTLPDGSYLLYIETNKRKRSLKQSAYYWGVCVPLVMEGLQDIGYKEIDNIETTHEIIKNNCLPKKRFVQQGSEDIIELPGSTAELTTQQFNEFIEEVMRFAASYLGVVIPYPNTQSSLQFSDGN